MPDKSISEIIKKITKNNVFKITLIFFIWFITMLFSPKDFRMTIGVYDFVETYKFVFGFGFSLCTISLLVLVAYDTFSILRFIYRRVKDKFDESDFKYDRQDVKNMSLHDLKFIIFCDDFYKRKNKFDKNGYVYSDYWADYEEEEFYKYLNEYLCVRHDTMSKLTLHLEPYEFNGDTHYYLNKNIIKMVKSRYKKLIN